MIVISAPFGNYLNFEGCVSTLGTYTLYKRAGLLRRLWRLIRTVRYNRRQHSWINKIGLPSPGIEALPEHDRKLVSIHGFVKEEWRVLASKIKTGVEFNLSCPNVGHKVYVADVGVAIEEALQAKLKVVCKLPPVRWPDYVSRLWDLGVRCFHLCNTIPSPGGGISGKPLMQFSLWAVEEVRKVYPASEIIGGGGVTCLEDVGTYLNAGADHVAVGSMLFNPFNWRKIKTFAAVATKEFWN